MERVFCLNMEERGPVHLLHGLIQKLCLLGLGVRARAGSPTHTALGQESLSESLLWNAEFVFPEKQS